MLAETGHAESDFSVEVSQWLAAGMQETSTDKSDETSDR